MWLMPVGIRFSSAGGAQTKCASRLGSSSDEFLFDSSMESERNCALWKVNDQAERLAELVSDAGDLKEAPLRRDVRSLGRLLGEVVKRTGWKRTLCGG